MDPVVIRNQGAETVWHPHRLEGFTLTCDQCAGQCDAGKPCQNAEPRYRVSHPRVPRDRPLFVKTDAEMRASGWEPVRLPEFLGRFLGGMVAIALTMLALWVIGMAGGLN